MNARSRFVPAAALGLVLAAVPVSAHHSFAAEYDANRPLTVTGTVTKLEWTNPHARVYIDAKDENGDATMLGYFYWHPWLFLFLIPAAGMRLWAEEKRTGTVELLFTLPITTLEAVLGKFFAAWAFL